MKVSCLCLLKLPTYVVERGTPEMVAVCSEVPFPAKPCIGQLRGVGLKEFCRLVKVASTFLYIYIYSHDAIKKVCRLESLKYMITLVTGIVSGFIVSEP